MKIRLEEIVNIIKGEIEEIKDLNSNDYDTKLSDLGVDSLDLSSMFLDLEENYDIEFTDDDIDNLNTVNKIVEFINKLKS